MTNIWCQFNTDYSD